MEIQFRFLSRLGFLDHLEWGHYSHPPNDREPYPCVTNPTKTDPYPLIQRESRIKNLRISRMWV